MGALNRGLRHDVDTHLAHVVARALVGSVDCGSPRGLVVSKRGQYAASGFVT